MNQEEESYTRETNLNGVASSRVTLEVPQKKMNKGVIILIVLVGIIAAGAIAVFAIGPGKVLNQFYKVVKTDRDYYMWLEKSNAQGILDSVCSDEKEDSNLKLDLNVSIEKSIANLIGITDPFVIHTEVDQKDNQMSGCFVLSYSNHEVLKLDVYGDKKENQLAFNIPELSDKYVSMNESTNQGIGIQLLQSSSLSDSIVRTMGTVMESCIDTVEVGEVSELKLNDTSINGTKIVVTYPLEQTVKQLTRTFTNLKNDERMQQAFEEGGVAKSSYRAFMDEMSTKIEELSELVDGSENIVRTCYVNDAGQIIGRQLQCKIEDTEYLFTLIVTEDKQIAASIQVNGVNYLVLEGSFEDDNKANEIVAVATENIVATTEYKKEIGSDAISKYVFGIIDSVGLSQFKDVISGSLESVDAGGSDQFEFTLGEYKGLTITAPEYEVTDQDINDEINEFLYYGSNALPVTNRDVVEDGDYVNIDFVGRIDRVEFENGAAEDYELGIGSHQFIDDFEEQLIGKKIGETVIVNATFPDDYQKDEMAGKEAEFTVIINSIGLREFTDEFVAYNTEFKTAEEYRENLSDELQETNDYDAQSELDDSILEQIVANSNFTSVNQGEIDQKAAEMMDTYKQYADLYQVTLEELVQQSFYMTMDDFTQEINYFADLYVKESYIIAEIAKQEGIVLTEDEYQARLEEIVTTYGYESTEQVEEENGGKEELERIFLEEKVLKFLRNSANIQ